MTRPQLSDNELAVLHGAAEGETYAETGRRIHLTEKSVGNVAVRIIDKFGARNITHAVILACRAGILDGRPRRHGDHAGFTAHVRAGEDPWACKQGCPEGERAYRAERRRARRAQETRTERLSRPEKPSGSPSCPEPPSSPQKPAQPIRDERTAA